MRTPALKIQVWRASCQDPIPPELQDKIQFTLTRLGGHLQIHGDIQPSPVLLAEQASMEKTTQRFRRIATTLADLNAEGFNAQTVNDLLTMYVGAASKHVLRTSFVPEQDVQNFDKQVTAFWSPHPTRRLSTSQTWRTWCGVCRSAACSGPIACLAIGHSPSMATTQ